LAFRWRFEGTDGGIGAFGTHLMGAMAMVK
jgi:hypothetical protein